MRAERNERKRGIAMLKTKYEYNFYSFYDHTGMEQHFEKMAAQGWLIEKLS